MSIVTANIPVPAVGDGVIVSVTDFVEAKTVVLSGRFSGSYELLASHDDVTFTPVLQFNAGGSESIRQTVSGAFKSVRLRSSAVAQGTVVCEVSAISGPAQNRFVTVGTLPAGFQGFSPIVDTAVAFPTAGAEKDICFICRGSFVGQVVLLGSTDGVNFNAISAFRADPVPDGSPTTILEFSVLSTEDKVRYLRLYVSDVDDVSGVVVTMGGRLLPGTTPPSGPAGGKLAGFYPNPTFADGDNGTGTLVHSRAATSISIGTGLAATALLEIAGSAAGAAGTASLKIDPGVLLVAPESGAVESDGTHLYWTDAGNVRHALDTGAESLAATYALGTVAADQTMVLSNALGGGIVIDATDPLLTGPNAFEIDVVGGAANFFTAGGLQLTSTLSGAHVYTNDVEATFNIVPPAGNSAFEASLNTLTFDPGVPAVGFASIDGYAVRGLVHVPATNATNFATNQIRLIASYNTVLNEGSGTIGEYLIGAWNEALHSGAGAMHRTYGSWNIGRLTAGSGQYIAGVISQAINEYGTVNSMVGIESNVISAGLGAGNNPTVASVFGVCSNISSVQGFGGTSIITSAYDFYAKNSVPGSAGYPIPPYSYGTITNYYGVYVEEHTRGANNWSIYSTGGISFLGGNTRLQLQSNLTVAIPAAGTLWNGLDFQASTLTLAAGGVVPTALSLAYFAAPTITSPAAYVVPTAATVTIAGPPVAAGGATITNPLALWVQTGKVLVGSATGLTTASTFIASMPNGNCSIGDETAGGMPFGPRIKFGALADDDAWLILGAYNGNNYLDSNGRALLFMQGVGAEAARISPAGDMGIGCVPNASTRLAVLADKSVVSAAGAVWNGIDFAASTLTLTGAVTPVTALSFFNISAPTITSASAITVASAATVTIQGPPVAAGSTTIANPLALHIPTGQIFLGAPYPTFVSAAALVCRSGFIYGGDAAAGTNIIVMDTATPGSNGTIQCAAGSYWSLGVGPATLAAGTPVLTWTPSLNVIIGDIAAGATAAKTLALTNTATSPSASANLAHLYCLDHNGVGGAAALALYQEAATVACGDQTVDRAVLMTVNGVPLWVMARSAAPV